MLYEVYYLVKIYPSSVKSAPFKFWIINLELFIRSFIRLLRASIIALLYYTRIKEFAKNALIFAKNDYLALR